MIYLDNAATAWPKAPEVAGEMARCVSEMGGSMGRGTYAAATENALKALTVREALCVLTGIADAECCILTPGATWALNQAILGFVRPGDHVLTSSLEHNAVLRPLHLAGAEVEEVPCDALSRTDPEAVSRRIRPAHALEECHGIMTRCGLHCSPAAHRALQSYPAGAVRFSFGWASTVEEVDQALQAVEEIART